MLRATLTAVCSRLTPAPTRHTLTTTAILSGFLLTGQGSPAHAYQSYCYATTEEQGIDIGNGMALSNWFYTPFSGWACSLVHSSNNVSMVWDVPTYGFLNQFGIRKIYKTVDASNLSATCYHDQTLWSNGAGSAYTGYYGWMYQPGIEWYIVENWFGPRPNGGVWKGYLWIDGGTYDIYKGTGGSGSDTWDQWWSVRKDTRAKGTISYVQHYKKWRQLGMANATQNFAGFFLECGWGQASKGQVDYHYVSITRP